MAMIGGSAEAGTGLAGAIAAKLDVACEGFNVEVGAPSLDAIAAAIVEYIQGNAVVKTQVNASVAAGINVQVDPGTHVGGTTEEGTAAQADAPGTIT